MKIRIPKENTSQLQSLITVLKKLKNCRIQSPPMIGSNYIDYRIGTKSLKEENEILRAISISSSTYHLRKTRAASIHFCHSVSAEILTTNSNSVAFVPSLMELGKLINGETGSILTAYTFNGTWSDAERPALYCADCYVDAFKPDDSELTVSHSGTSSNALMKDFLSKTQR